MVEVEEIKDSYGPPTASGETALVEARCPARQKSRHRRQLVPTRAEGLAPRRDISIDKELSKALSHDGPARAGLAPCLEAGDRRPGTQTPRVCDARGEALNTPRPPSDKGNQRHVN